MLVKSNKNTSYLMPSDTLREIMLFSFLLTLSLTKPFRGPLPLQLPWSLNLGPNNRHLEQREQ